MPRSRDDLAVLKNIAAGGALESLEETVFGAGGFLPLADGGLVMSKELRRCAANGAYMPVPVKAGRPESRVHMVTVAKVLILLQHRTADRALYLRIIAFLQAGADTAYSCLRAVACGWNRLLCREHFAAHRAFRASGEPRFRAGGCLCLDGSSSDTFIPLHPLLRIRFS